MATRSRLSFAGSTRSTDCKHRPSQSIPLWSRGGLESLLAILIGICLAASSGFRVFVPMLILSIAAKADMLALSDGFQWLDTWPALIALAIATLVEVAAYYIPWLDNALDTLSVPAAAVAGTLLMAASVSEFNPLLGWSLAIVAGGGSAALVSTATSAARAVATATTGGLANFIVSTLELMGSILISVLAILAPVVGVALLLVILVMIISYGRSMLGRWFRRDSTSPKSA